MKNLTIIADDLGLTQEISDGIIYCAKEDLIDGAAVLVNAPASEYVFSKLDELETIELGLHLSLVEGYSLSGGQSLLEKEEYFPGRPCLRLNWKKFAKDFLTGKISRKELRDEFEAQVELYKKKVGTIQFLNSTQHLHILPGINDIVFKLCKDHGIRRIRTPNVTVAEMRFTKEKLFGGAMIKSCAVMNDALTQMAGLESLGTTYGITISGQTDEAFVDFMLAQPGRKEFVIHPGYDCPELKASLPENYAHFDWEKELRALEYLKERRDD